MYMKYSEGTSSGNQKQIFFSMLEWLVGCLKVMWDAGGTIFHCEGLGRAFLVFSSLSSACPITVLTKK